MIALWDTTGNEVVKALSAERRNAGGVASGLALTLVAVGRREAGPRGRDRRRDRRRGPPVPAADRGPQPRSGQQRARPSPGWTPRSSSAAGSARPRRSCMRMHGRLARHAESVVIPLLAPDVPVVTWWHGAPPERIATDPLGVLAERRITDAAQAADPVAALRQRAEDYAPGDTDLAWTRTTPWRSLLAGALDTATVPGDRGDRHRRRGRPDRRAARAAGCGPGSASTPTVRGPRRHPVHGLAAAGRRRRRSPSTTRTAWPAATAPACRPRTLPLAAAPLGDQLAEELRRLDADQPYAAALEAATGVTGLATGPASRVHIWHDPEPNPTSDAEPSA